MNDKDVFSIFSLHFYVCELFVDNFSFQRNVTDVPLMSLRWQKLR